MGSASTKIEEGDRVDHRMFGLGTVTDIEGDRVEIEFDDKPGDPKRVLASFLVKIASAETRPFKFWNRQWLELHANWLEARRAFEAEVSQFRPLPDAEKLAALRTTEDSAWSRVTQFLTDERNGHHI